MSQELYERLSVVHREVGIPLVFKTVHSLFPGLHVVIHDTEPAEDVNLFHRDGTLLLAIEVLTRLGTTNSVTCSRRKQRNAERLVASGVPLVFCTERLKAASFCWIKEKILDGQGWQPTKQEEHLGDPEYEYRFIDDGPTKYGRPQIQWSLEEVLFSMPGLCA